MMHMPFSCFKLRTLYRWIFINNSYVVLGLKAPSRDYDIPGSSTSRIFTTIGAAASLVFAFNTGMLPEIQVPKASIFQVFARKLT